MMKHSSLKYIFPLGLFISFCLDGSINQIFPAEFLNSHSMITYLSFLWIFFTAFFSNQDNYHLEVWSAILGLVFDSYYVGILGVYVFIFPLTIYLSRLLYKYLPFNFLSIFLIYFIDITLISILSYIATRFSNQIAHFISMSGSNFLANGLGPTLIINLILFTILYFPIQWLFNWYQQSK